MNTPMDASKARGPDARNITNGATPNCNTTNGTATNGNATNGRAGANGVPRTTGSTNEPRERGALPLADPREKVIDGMWRPTGPPSRLAQRRAFSAIGRGFPSVSGLASAHTQSSQQRATSQFGRPSQPAQPAAKPTPQTGPANGPHATNGTHANGTHSTNGNTTPRSRILTPHRGLATAASLPIPTLTAADRDAHARPPRAAFRGFPPARDPSRPAITPAAHSLSAAAPWMPAKASGLGSVISSNPTTATRPSTTPLANTSDASTTTTHSTDAFTTMPIDAAAPTPKPGPVTGKPAPLTLDTMSVDALSLATLSLDRTPRPTPAQLPCAPPPTPVRAEYAEPEPTPRATLAEPTALTALTGLPITHVEAANGVQVPVLPNFNSGDEVWAACSPHFAWYFNLGPSPPDTCKIVVDRASGEVCAQPADLERGARDMCAGHMSRFEAEMWGVAHHG